jgi:hypothetical protein
MAFARKRSIAKIREDLLRSADLDRQVIERVVPKRVATEQKAPGLVRMVAGFVFINQVKCSLACEDETPIVAIPG